MLMGLTRLRYIPKKNNISDLARIEGVPDPMSSKSLLGNGTRTTVADWMTTVLVDTATSIRKSLLLVAGMSISLKPAIFSKTSRRWMEAVSNNGFPSIGFAGINFYKIQSADLFETSPKLPVGVSIDTDSFWSLLPSRVSTLLQSRVGKQLIGITNVSINPGGISVTAIPSHSSCWLPMTQEISRTELQFIADQARYRDFPTTVNRVTTRSLHRLGVICAPNATADVTSISIRIGRVVSNQAKLLEDLLVSKDYVQRSVLVIGPPRSGKTALLRDVAKQLRLPPHETYVIDTWNELGGGGDDAIPLEGLGETSTIRCMIAERKQQGAVIRDCIRNHNVHTLIVDEVEFEDDFMALWAAKERGIRLIVGIQGTFASLQKGTRMQTSVTTQMSGVCDLVSNIGQGLFSSLVEMNADDPTSVKVTLDFENAARNGFGESILRSYNPATGSICIKPGG